MEERARRVNAGVVLVIAGVMMLVSGAQKQSASGELRGEIPQAWDDEAASGFQVPLADGSVSREMAKSEYYYRIPVRTVYKSYAVYAPGREPSGYMEWLKQQEPEVVFDASKLKTAADWIQAGEMVFDNPNVVGQHTGADLQDPEWHKKGNIPVAKDGVMPFFRYVIGKKGEIQVGSFSCATCHVRLMPDGTVIKGAQGNYPNGALNAISIRKQAAKAQDKNKALERIRFGQRISYSVPWLHPDPHECLDRMSVEEIASAHAAVPPGVVARQGSSVFFPPQIPDLIGLKDRRYFDHTGFERHRGIRDLMRFASLEDGGEVFLYRFGDFIPSGKLLDPGALLRYSDEQLYALAQYLYSLKPPPNPNKFDKQAARGEKIFEREGCSGCHTPPLYTNNKLTPAEGFKVPEDHLKRFEIMNVTVGTDPGLAMKTRRGTGYYKVPSLKGVWYRGPFEHSGSVATLEEWFDPKRTREDYTPGGYKGYGVERRAVKGHKFGLNLSGEDRKALIAFLKTL